MSAHLDQAGPVRRGEELPAEPLRAWLGEALCAPVARLEVEQFPGGYSNLTYLVRADGRELVLRRPPFGSKVKRAHDMRREHRILSSLAPLVPWAPRPIAFSDDASVMGADFYVMERIRGVVLRRSVPPGLVLDEAAAGRLASSLVATLAELHGVDWRAATLGEIGRPEGYVRRQVSGWAERWANARTSTLPEMDAVGDWLARRLPPESAPALIHNDFKFDNVVYDSVRFERIVGVLDWEMATIGDPLADLGTSLAYWVDPEDDAVLQALSFGPTALPGMPRRAAVAEMYARATGRDLGAIVFHYVLGLYKTAVVLQQIYARWKQGLTQDPRFAALDLGVAALARRAAQAIERDCL
jgi:aminoglycoside phosphotransferase (APT) family kinase protein